jgi:hypothetical protein
VVGDIVVTGEALDLPADPGLRIITYTVEPGSPAHEALAFLASWSSQAEPAGVLEAPAPTDADS